MSVISNTNLLNDNTKYFFYNCEYRKEMETQDKIKLPEEIAKDHLADALDYELDTNPFIPKLLSFFKKSGYSLNSIANKSRNGLHLELEFSDSFISEKVLTYRINHLLKRDILLKKAPNGYIIIDKPLFKVTFDSIVLAKGNIYISGDNILIKQFQNDLYFCLSDGMGSGLKAYEASKSLLNKIAKLIDLEMSDKKLLTNLSHLYNLSGFNDSYGTLDFLHISKNSNTAYLYKVASTTTYHLTEKGITSYKTSSLPLEANGEITCHELILHQGDLILLMSDGVTEFVDETKLKNFILGIEHKNTDKIVYELSKYVYDESRSRLMDDVSIIAIKIL